MEATLVPTNAVLAKRLGLKTSSAERKLGFKTPADLIREIKDVGVRPCINKGGDEVEADAWGVVTHQGTKHYLPKSEVQ